MTPVIKWLKKTTVEKDYIPSRGLYVPSRRVEFVDDNTKMLVY